MNELTLTPHSNRVMYAQMLHALDVIGADLVSEEDYQQLLYPMDQIYIDYRWEGQPFTLHLEHTLGISLLSEVLDGSVLQTIADKIAAVLSLHD